MLSWLRSPGQIPAQPYLLAIVRIACGLFMLYHGAEIFDGSKMQEYASWTGYRGFPSAGTAAYTGKSLELIAGVLLLLGWFTRLGALLLMGVMLYISLVLGNGIIWYNDQHPFLFVLLGLIFIAAGPGAWSIDQWIRKKT